MMKDANWYFQDKLAKFCPADKDRPNGYERSMFDYGKEEAQAEIESLRQKLAVAEDALGYIQSENKYITISCDGPTDFKYWREQELKSRNRAYEALAKIRGEG
jgi:hypothetical protein